MKLKDIMAQNGLCTTNREGRKFWVRPPIKFGVGRLFYQFDAPDPEFNWWSDPPSRFVVQSPQNVETVGPETKRSAQVLRKIFAAA
jgi:hypothetical protein